MTVIHNSTVHSAHMSSCHIWLKDLGTLVSFAAENSYHETHSDGPDVTAVIQWLSVRNTMTEKARSC